MQNDWGLLGSYSTHSDLEPTTICSLHSAAQLLQDRFIWDKSQEHYKEYLGHSKKQPKDLAARCPRHIASFQHSTTKRSQQGTSYISHTSAP